MTAPSSPSRHRPPNHFTMLSQRRRPHGLRFMDPLHAIKHDAPTPLTSLASAHPPDPPGLRGESFWRAQRAAPPSTRTSPTSTPRSLCPVSHRISHARSLPMLCLLGSLVEASSRGSTLATVAAHLPPHTVKLRDSRCSLYLQRALCSLISFLFGVTWSRDTLYYY